MEEQKGLWRFPAERNSDSLSLTPSMSAPCSPGGSTDIAMSCFLSASTPTSPVKEILNMDSLPDTGNGLAVAPSSLIDRPEQHDSDDFDFSARFSEADQPWSATPMSCADELFFNGQIRPLWYTSDDSACWCSAHSEHNGDDSHFDFQSSADYKFTMLSLSFHHSSSTGKQEHYVGYDSRHESCEHNRACPAGRTSGLRIDHDAMWNGDDVQRTAAVSLQSQGSRKCESDTIASHILYGKVKENRGRHVGRRNRDGGTRIARSLSPLRIFHMDDELPRQSLGATQCFHAAKENSNATAEKGEKWEEGAEVWRREGVRFTLKELLHANEQREPGNFFSRKWMWTRLKQQSKACVEAKSIQASNFRPKSSPKQDLENRTRVPSYPMHGEVPRLPHGLYYRSSPRVQSEHIRQQTFLPYRHGLLGCLGLTSRSHHSVTGLKTRGMRWPLQSKRQVMR